MISAAFPSAEPIGRAEARRARLIMPAVVLMAVLAGIAAAKLASQGHPAVIVLFALVPIPLAIWRWPHGTVVFVLAGAVVVEQFPYTVGPRKGVLTDNIPLFHSLSKGSGVSPLELLMLVISVVWLMKAALNHSLRLPHSPLAKWMAGFLGLVVVGLGLGLAHSGKLKVALWEVRPWVYMTLMYLLASSLIRTRRTLRTLLWTLVLGSGFKSILGVMMFVAVRHMQPRPEATLGHEEAFFFGLFIILTLGLWIFQIRGPLRVTATCFLPLVFLANLGNSRRNAWAILGLTLVELLVLAYRSLPHRRRMLKRLGAGILVASAVYFPAFWNHGGTIGQPARALHSAISPDARDLQSNQYRRLENANLILNIQQSKSMGKGFGVPINYDIPMTDLRGTDSFIAYVPHDGVLYIWMRLGFVGEIVFMAMIAAAIIRASQLTKVADKELALFGSLVVCAVVAYLVQGYNDMGFFWFRIALCMGILLGAVEAALRLAPTRESTPVAAP